MIPDFTILHSCPLTFVSSDERAVAQGFNSSLSVDPDALLLLDKINDQLYVLCASISTKAPSLFLQHPVRCLSFSIHLVPSALALVLCASTNIANDLPQDLKLGLLDAWPSCCCRVAFLNIHAPRCYDWPHFFSFVFSTLFMENSSISTISVDTTPTS